MNTTNIKMISCDLDGTLLNSRGEISTYSKHILIDLQKHGYCLVLNSGRFYHEVKPFIDQLALANYGGYVICSNGYMIYDCQKHSFHSFDSIAYQECMRIFAIAKKKHVPIFYYANETYSICTSRPLLYFLYICKTSLFLSYPFLPLRFKKYAQMFRHTRIHHHENIPTFDKVEKLCFLQLPFLLHKLKYHIQHNVHGYNFFDVNAYSVEMVKENVSKANAIAHICEEKGYTIKNVIAFGDAGNDIPLLQQAGIGVLMKNAHTHMKSYANFYSDLDNDQDGVAAYLKKHILEMVKKDMHL